MILAALRSIGQVFPRMFLHSDDVFDVSLVICLGSCVLGKDHKGKMLCHHIIISRVHTINLTYLVDVNLDHLAEKVKDDVKPFDDLCVCQGKQLTNMAICNKQTNMTRF